MQELCLIAYYYVDVNDKAVKIRFIDTIFVYGLRDIPSQVGSRVISNYCYTDAGDTRSRVITVFITRRRY